MTANQQQYQGPLDQQIVEHLYRPLFYSVKTLDADKDIVLDLTRLELLDRDTKSTTISIHHLLAGWTRLSSGPIVVKLDSCIRALASHTVRIFILPPGITTVDVTERTPHYDWDLSQEFSFSFLVHPACENLYVVNGDHTNHARAHCDITMGTVVIRSIGAPTVTFGSADIRISIVPLFNYSYPAKTVLGNRLFTT